MNPNPNQARKAKGERRRSALLPAIEAVTKALKTATEILETGEDDAIRLRAVHAVSQSAVCFARLYEVGELESRIEALEEAVDV